MVGVSKTVVFGGGCFWCTEAVFRMLKGVSNVEPGYAGGTVENPSYEAVSDGGTMWERSTVLPSSIKMQKKRKSRNRESAEAFCGAT